MVASGDAPALLVTQLDPGPGREPLHGLGEAQVLDPLHELDDVAALGAGEAVPEPAGRGDVEREGLLVVEGAQAFQRAAAGVAQLEVLPHHLVDGGLLADECDVLIADPARHWHPPPSSLLPVAASLVPAADSRSPPRTTEQIGHDRGHRGARRQILTAIAKRVPAARMA